MKKVLFRGEIDSRMLQSVVIGTILIGFATLLSGDSFPSISAPTGIPVTIVPPKPDSGKASLQLQTFGYTTGSPEQVSSPSSTTSAGGCGPSDDTGIPVSKDCPCHQYDDTIAINCKDGAMLDDNGQSIQGQSICDDNGQCRNFKDVCGTPLAPTDGRYCIAKPVIYLYPKVPTLVAVSVATRGNIVVSDPHYPQGGWKNVLAFPSGNLVYDKKNYTELFYESSVTSVTQPQKGIVIPTNDLTNRLGGILDQLGLVTHEKEEFLQFWVPRLTKLKSPYIYFSLVDRKEKEQLDKVTISPKPDTQIAFIAYFKPITDPQTVDGSLMLPPKPQRVGFVSVEWGGSIDRN